jgi:hypothetical protein
MSDGSTAQAINWPLAVLGMVRARAGSVGDLDLAAGMRTRTGRDLEAWLDPLSEIQRDRFVRNVGELVALLDEIGDPPGGGDVDWPSPMTAERREVILGMLRLPADLRAEIGRRNPLLGPTTASPLLWVDPDTAPEQPDNLLHRTAGPRWHRYIDHLAVREWSVADVDGLGRDLDRLVSAIPDPLVEARSPRRVLVVGHTQSGKTANFLGLAARMADAGTGLVVILSGRTKILRRQTQARIDRDLIGRDPLNIGVLREEYAGAPRLLERLADPSPDEEASIWTRLSRARYGESSDDDAYPQPIPSLDAIDRSRPAVVVLKKTPGDLEAFDRALRSATAGFRRMAAIVIDEEADDASLNYRAPQRPGGGWGRVTSPQERSRINALIASILKRLERSTYLGYTATPFANCFADANDPDGFFPHAIQVLDTPDGYFGASRVFDPLYVGPPGAILPQEAHIREIQPHDRDTLDGALDDYLLAGGVKLFRRDLARRLGDTRAEQRLRHHSMMVHTKTGRQAQRDTRDEVHRRFFTARRRGLQILGPEDTADRLRGRYETDHRRISMNLTSVPGRLPTPELRPEWVPDWEELRPFVVEAGELLLRAEREAPGVVLLVNSDEDRETPEYDADASSTGRWCVLVGGLMLSRGFTVEGLTTVYFRRIASAMDTQLQLARWNGYRNYFEDTVRLYFGVAEPHGRKGTRNLYEEFEESAIRDYEFREQLRRYAEDGTSPRRELPRFIIPPGRTRGLRPTAPRKMAGVVRTSGAPIEFGRRGSGLPPDNRAISMFGAAAGLRGPYRETPMCAACADTDPSRRLQLVTTSATWQDVRDVLDQARIAMQDAPGVQLSAEDERWLQRAAGRAPWLVAVIGGTREIHERTLPLGPVDVPVRLRRRTTAYDTLSTGPWNDWMRITAGGPCSMCGGTVATPNNIIVVVPYRVEERDPVEKARWGFLVQLVGRTAGTELVGRPSPRD